MKNIKRLSLILAAAFTLGSGVAMANDTNSRDKKTDPKVRAEKMTERMVKEYGLNDTQKQQIFELNQTLVEKTGDRSMKHHRNGRKGKDGQIADTKRQNREAKADKNKERKNKEVARSNHGEHKNRPDAPKLSPEEREKKRAERKQIREDYNTQLQKIMSADQFQTYTKKQAEREQKRQERGEKGKEKRSNKSTTSTANNRQV